jgi:aldehyde:ferredoxin oxidoreductase
MAGSINRRILRVDLSDGKIWTEEPDDAFYRKHPGGRAIVAHYLLTEVPAGTDPLGPDNRLIFACGPMTGVQLPGNARHSVGARSPLTGFYGEGEAGGFWNAELKSAGWDAIVVQGAAERPVYLWIEDQAVEIRDASHLWGKITGDVQEAIQAELGEDVRVAQTGIAGENLVKIACVCNDLNEFAGRTGLGAVMGSKKLKAIAVRGSNRIMPADIGPIRETTRWVPTTFDEGQEHFIWHEWGTGARVREKQIGGHVISHNFRDGMLEGAENVDAQAMKDTVVNYMDGCFACSVRCKKRVKFATAKVTVDDKYGGPEYESFAAIGSNCGVVDMITICKASEMMNYLALDSISTGSAIAWAMEMVELGKLTPDDLQGAELRWGNAEDLLTIIEMIARREGIGDLLAEGATRAARKLGKDSEKYVVAVKGLDLGMHDPRAMERMRRQFPVGPVGGDHIGGAHKEVSLENTLGLCDMLAYDEDLTLRLLNAATGWDMTPEELDGIYERGITMARLFNLRQGMTTADDKLPWRMHQPLTMGPLKDEVLSVEQVRGETQDYYEARGWDRDEGVPQPATIARLGLEYVAD